MKLGVVCEGGAYRVMFSCGVLDGLLDAGVTGDYFIGVSAGIAYGISYVTEQRKRNYDVLSTYAADPRYLGLRNFFKPGNRSIYDRDFAFHTVPNQLIPFDYDAFAAYPGEVLGVTTDVETGGARYHPMPRDESCMTLLEASCAMPLLFPIIEYGGGKHLDGGIADPIPYARALADGCDRIIVVLTRERGYRKGKESFGGLMGRYYRKYPAFTAALAARSERYNRQREELFALEEEGRALVFCPESTQGFSRMEKDPKKLEAMYQHGLARCAEKGEALGEFASGGKLSYKKV